MSFNRAGFFFFFFKYFFLFLKEPIVSITWTIHPELSSFPPSPSFTSTHVRQHHFRAEFCKEEGYWIYLGGRKVEEELMYPFIFCHFPVQDCKDSSYERIWRLNMTPWHTQVVMQCREGAGCENARKQFGSRTSFRSVANWSHVPLVPWTYPWNLYLGKTAFEGGRTQVLCLPELSFKCFVFSFP